MKDLFTVLFFLCITQLLVNCTWSPPEEIAAIYANLPEEIDFNFHVKPILSDKCFACHGPDKSKQKAGLRLDLMEVATSKLEETRNIAIVPGDPNNSELIKRIFSHDQELVMPPPEFKVELTVNEKAILAKWIEQGAEYKTHWSFIKPEDAEPPVIEDEDWVNNDIDHFVKAVLEEKEIKPSPEAEKEVLIRRLSFDLRGLPPSLTEIDDFINDTSPDAYENLVDRFLASSAYGERMAADWMDVARYSDTDGYLDDKHRDFSPYRDWVIDAFNANMTYKDFATWQLAGDLIENVSKESTLATAFNRLHKRNSEAGIVFEEFRLEYVADKTLTLGKAFLGLSVECARCHDHKYDAISQKEYYELSAFFNNTREIGTAVYGPSQVPGPSLLLTSDQEDEILKYIDQQIEDLTEAETNLKHNLNFEKDEIEKIIKQSRRSMANNLLAHYPFESLSKLTETTQGTPNLANPGQEASVKEVDQRQGSKGQGIFVSDYTRIVLPEKQGWFDISDPFSISISLNPPKVFEEVGILYHCEELRLGLKGYSLYLEDNQPKFIISSSWPSNAIQVKATQSIPPGKWTDLTITYDGLGAASGLRMYLDGQEVEVEVELDNLYKSILFKWDIHTYGFTGFQLGMRDKMQTFLGGGLDELKIYTKELTPLEVYFSGNNEASDNITSKNLKSIDSLLSRHLVEVDSSKLKNKGKRRALLNERIRLLDSVDEIMVMRELPELRPTYVLDRGMYDARGEVVSPSTPERVLAFNDNLPKNRLGLSQWLFDEDNPLTARVYVNRIWQMHFGQGLVESSDDFGNQGKLPSHPQLLDWLAVQFVESDWDIKKLHKLILMSSTYRQSSKHREDLEIIDPNNTYLAKGPSYRMTAEMIRDNVLALSGLLSRKIGGKSVYPYQPEGLWDEISSKSWRYPYLQEAGEGLYRRSLYTIWKRTSPPPSMTIFDVGERGVCTVKRTETSTPLQALVLLNDPQYIEACRTLAEQILMNNKDVNQQLTTAFRSATGRSPNTDETKVLKEFYLNEKEKFANRKEDALAYASTGSLSLNTELDVRDIAALTIVINGIINTSDGYTIR